MGCCCLGEGGGCHAPSGVERGFSLSPRLLSPAARTALPAVGAVLGTTLPIKPLQSQSCLASYLGDLAG